MDATVLQCVTMTVSHDVLHAKKREENLDFKSRCTSHVCIAEYNDLKSVGESHLQLHDTNRV
jgi:hypothetical protein